MSLANSEALFQRAQAITPGGVNSPVRSFNSVGGTPPFIKRGEGAYLIDEDDNRYIDYVCSWGPLILGHAYPEVVRATQEAVANGLSFGAATAAEITLAEKICDLMPNIEQVRLVNSGTEASMSAIRLARGFTHRNKIIKFAGCYHGHADALLVNAGSGALTFGVPSSAGVPTDFVQHTLTATFNDLDTVAQWFEQFPDDIAAVILEPVAANMNLIQPQSGFLEGLRELCDRYNSLLIFDEVITGFRVDLHGAQGLYNIKPDLTILGKVIGGGMPVGAFGGRKEIMAWLSPLGPVYQAGTLSGNPVAVAAGLANLEIISQPGFFEQVIQKTENLTKGLRTVALNLSVDLEVSQVGSLFGLCFSEKPVMTLSDVTASNTKLYQQFFHTMLEEGVYLAPSAFEAGFLSIAHSDADIAHTLQAAEKALRQISKKTQVGV